MADHLTEHFNIIRSLNRSKNVRTQVVRRLGTHTPDLVVRVLRHEAATTMNNAPLWHLSVRHANFAPTLEVGCSRRGEIYYLRDFYNKRACVSPTPEFITGV